MWDENTSDGRYVQENCKPLRVGAAPRLLEGWLGCEAQLLSGSFPRSSSVGLRDGHFPW